MNCNSLKWKHEVEVSPYGIRDAMYGSVQTGHHGKWWVPKGERQMGREEYPPLCLWKARHKNEGPAVIASKVITPVTAAARQHLAAKPHRAA